MRASARTVEWAAVAAVTLAAAALRLVHIGEVPPDPFYDAAVRSMSLSLHNFFFGVYEPGGSVSIDKPPVDLWLQVISTKIVGFSSTSLKLPEALAGIASVPLLYVLVRRMWNATAGLIAAIAMAVLPIEVITARSDTMDGVMMFVILIALACVMRAMRGGHVAWLLAGAAALGVAFDVKLLESLVALPGLALFAYLGLPGTRVRRLLSLAGAGVVYVVVALAWLTATLLFPAHERPYAIGSTNGSAWNAAFVFNGTDRLGGKSPEPGATIYKPGHRYPVATQEQRDHIPIVPPSPTRLLATVGPLSGQRLGLELLVALLLGIPALAWGVLADRDGDREAPRERAGPQQGAPVAQAAQAPPAGGGREAPPAGDREAPPHTRERAAPPRPAHHDEEAAVWDLRRRMRRAAAGGLCLWMLTGIVLYSHMVRLHPRYVESFTPPVAAMLGIGLAWATACLRARVGGRGAADGGGADAQLPEEDSRGGRAAGAWARVRVALLALTLAVVVYYSERLLYGVPAVWWVSLAGALAALACVLLARARALPGTLRRVLAPAGAIATSLVAIAAVPLKTDETAIANRVSDAGLVGQIPGDQQRPLSAYLLAHQDGAYYELAAESATAVGSLIVQDAKPVLVLTTYDARVFTSVAKLKRLVAHGKVRYAFLNTFCVHGEAAESVNPACAAPVRWIRAHGTDVSLRAGLAQGGLLYLLPGAKP